MKLFNGFCVQHVKGTTSIVEVEGEVLWTIPGTINSNKEFRVKVTRPAQFAGEVWYSWSLFPDESWALAQAEADMVDEAKRNERKHGVLYDPLKVLEKVKDIKVTKL